MELIKCSKCGTEFDENLKVCPECGENVSNVEEVQVGENTNREEVQDENVNVVNEDSNSDVEPNLAQSESDSKIGNNDFMKTLLKDKKKLIIIGTVLVAVIIVGSLFKNKVICFHDWKDATCTKSQICTKCNRTKGEALGHDWIDATCTEPKTCARCGKVEGEMLGHSVKEWNTTTEATCSAEGICVGECTVCGVMLEKTIEKIEHTPGEWKVTKAAEWNAAGERTQECTVCGAVIKTEEYELSAAEKESIFKSGCQTFSYEQVARDPDSYFLQHCVFTGKVVQVMEDDGDFALRVNVTKTSYSYTDTIYVYYMKSANEGKTRILEDDIITIYGYNFGLMSYESVLGAEITIPSVVAEYIDIN